MTETLADALAWPTGQPERFLRYWFGEPTVDRPHRTFDDLPPSLAAWQRLLQRWQPGVLRQNRLAERLEVDGDVTLVGVEAQAVWLWGVRTGEDASPVHERENADGAAWTSTGERLDEFLWHFLLVDAVFGADHGLGKNDATRAELAAVTAGCERLPVRPWRWPGPEHALWRLEDLLLWTVADDRPDSRAVPERYSVFVGARSADELAAAADALALDWDVDSRQG